MRVCLIPLKTEIRNPALNLERLTRRLDEVAHYRPDLVCLPECTLTGYLYDENSFRHFAEAVPGPSTERMGQLARRHAIALCFGLLEAARSGVYNSAVLLDRTGRVVLKHRKIEEKPPFTNGDTVGSVDTESGRLGILICGDLFNRDVVRRLDSTLDWLIVPMWRSFDGHSPDVGRWTTEERQAYLEAVKATGVTALIVNALATEGGDSSFGGAMIVSAKGELLAESPHGTDEVLSWDLGRQEERPWNGDRRALSGPASGSPAAWA